MSNKINTDGRSIEDYINAYKNSLDEAYQIREILKYKFGTEIRFIELPNRAVGSKSHLWANFHVTEEYQNEDQKL